MEGSEASARLQHFDDAEPPLSSRRVRPTRVTKRAVAIRHVAFEDLGVFAGPIESAGFRIDYLDAGVDDLQAAAGADLLFVLGGPISANDEARYTFLAVERTLLSQPSPPTGRPWGSASARDSSPGPPAPSCAAAGRRQSA